MHGSWKVELSTGSVFGEEDTGLHDGFLDLILETIVVAIWQSGSNFGSMYRQYMKFLNWR